MWGLVNNAGIISPLGPYHWLNREDILKVLQVNLVGTIEVTNALYPLIRVARGRVVNVSSAVALFPSSGTIYTASKAGIEAFSDNIRYPVTSKRSINHHVRSVAGGYRHKLCSTRLN